MSFANPLQPAIVFAIDFDQANAEPRVMLHPDGQTVEQRLNEAKSLGWEIPDWLFDDPVDGTTN